MKQTPLPLRHELVVDLFAGGGASEGVSEEDAIAEGITANDWKGDNMSPDRARKAFRNLWESMHGHGSWEEAPLVWAISFGVFLANVDEVVK